MPISPARAADMAIGLADAFAAAALAVTGPETVPLTAAAFAALPRTAVEWTVHDEKFSCTGPWLIDVVAAAEVPTDDKVRGEALATLVVATGADGYPAVFTLAELDRTLGNAPVVVAERCNGAPLTDGAGPLRLVPARDKRGARGVRGLVRLEIDRLPMTP